MISAHCRRRVCAMRWYSTPPATPQHLLVMCPPPVPTIPPPVVKFMGPTTHKALEKFNDPLRTLDTVIFYHTPSSESSCENLAFMRALFDNSQRTYTSLAPLRFRLAVTETPPSPALLRALFRGIGDPHYFLRNPVQNRRHRDLIPDSSLSAPHDPERAKNAQGELLEDVFMDIAAQTPEHLKAPLILLIPTMDSVNGWFGKVGLGDVKTKRKRNVHMAEPPVFIGDKAAVQVANWLQKWRRKLIGQGRLGLVKGSEKMWREQRLDKRGKDMWTTEHRKAVRKEQKAARIAAKKALKRQKKAEAKREQLAKQTSQIAEQTGA
ncbi:hypothetical protein MKEN_00351400 [Mycena kentingensis (nom. inval.)]|nr:hypothetical protein MKEN_00351400 [Mycena kentingensis (nom. inval.)]